MAITVSPVIFYHSAKFYHARNDISILGLVSALFPFSIFFPLISQLAIILWQLIPPHPLSEKVHSLICPQSTHQLYYLPLVSIVSWHRQKKVFSLFFLTPCIILQIVPEVERWRNYCVRHQRNAKLISVVFSSVAINQ